MEQFIPQSGLNYQNSGVSFCFLLGDVVSKDPPWQYIEQSDIIELVWQDAKRNLQVIDSSADANLASVYKSVNCEINPCF